MTGDPAATRKNDPRATDANASPNGSGAAGSGKTTTAADIEIPVQPIKEFRPDGLLLEEAQGAAAERPHPLSGIWEQFDGPNDSDFGPGGYQRSAIAVNPANNSIVVYRSYRGDVAIVVGGQLAFARDEQGEGKASGRITVRKDPSQSSRFNDRPLRLGGAPSVTVEPPDGAGPWSVEWRREGVQLVLGDKRYRAMNREEFEKLRVGGADAAEGNDLAERIPEPAPDAARADAKETSFFGLRGGGKRVCYVVDMSGSMQGEKFERLKRELEQAIAAFQPEQLFSVVFFDEAAHVVDPGWMLASRDRDRAIGLVRQQGCGNGTDPTKACEFAFQTLDPVPDLVFFMTDGLIPAGIPDLLRRMNAGAEPTRINTINFGEPEAVAIMKQIARENRGDYIFISP